MKFNFVKKVIALASITATLALSMVVANADYKDTSFPYSNNFEHWGVASWDFWLVPAYDTGLGATAYGSGITPAQIVADADPAHNMVYYMNRPASDGTERFIYWLLPSVSEGKFVFEFDAKTTGNGIWFTGRQNSHAGSGEPRILSMANNAIKVGDTVVGTYANGEWKSFKVLFDVETGNVTVFVDGESGVINSSFFKTSCAMYFVVDANSTMSLDNIKTYRVDGSVSPSLTLEENGEAVGAFADESTDSFVLSLDGAEFGVLPEVEVTCFGEDMMSADDDYAFEVSTEFAGGKVIITPEDYLEAGSKYAVTVAEGTTDMFGRFVDTTPVVFTAAENDGWVINKEYYTDFSDATAFSTSSLTVGKLSPVTSPSSAQLLTGSDYEGGKAVKWTGGDMLIGVGAKTKGKLELDMKMKMENGSVFAYDAGEYVWNDVITYNYWVSASGKPIEIQYQPADPSAPNFYQSCMTSNSPEMDVFNYTFDFDKNLSYGTVNENPFSVPLPAKFRDDLARTNNVRNLRFLSGGFTVDYIGYKHSYIPATVESIEAVDMTAGKVATSSQIVIKFSENVKADTLSNITVSDGSANVAYTGAWDAESLTYTLTFDSGLKGETKYTVTVPATVTDNFKFAASEAYGTFETAPVPPMEVENLAATIEDGNVTVSVDLKNAAGEVYLAVASYEGNVMKDMNFVAVPVTGSSTEASYTFENLAAGTTVKAFAIKDMATIMPYCAAVEVK